MAAADYLRGHAPPRLAPPVTTARRARQPRDRPGPGARLRDVCARPSRTDAFAERAFRAGAEERGLAGRERAQAQRLAYGAIQRRGTLDAAIERLADRSTRLLDPPVLAALRLGLYELLFADGDPRPRRRRPGGRAGQGGEGRPRRRLRQRDPAPGGARARGAAGGAARATTRPPRPPRSPTRRRSGWRGCGGRSSGAEAARSLLAAANQPAEVAMRVDRCGRARRSRRAARPPLAKLAEAGVEARAAAGPWPLAAPELIVVSGRIGEAVPALVAAGELTPQSRASAAVVEVLDPQPGRARPRPLRRAGDQDRPDRRPDRATAAR